MDDGTIYARRGNSFTQLSGALTGFPASPTRVAFSPDGQLLGATAPSGVFLWRVGSGDPVSINNFIRLTFSETINGIDLGGIGFSPDGQYFGVGHDTFPRIQIFKINPDYTITEANITATIMPDIEMYGIEVMFSPDSNYAFMRTNSTVLPVAVFRRTGTREYTYMTAPDNVGGLPLDKLTSSYALSIDLAH
jgi:WD40 repeat protein